MNPVRAIRVAWVEIIPKNKTYGVNAIVALPSRSNLLIKLLLCDTLNYFFFGFLNRPVKTGNPTNCRIFHNVAFSWVDNLIGKLAHDRSLMKTR